MVDVLVGLVGKPAIVVVLVFLIYWLTEWLKRVLKDKLQSVWIQPITFVIGSAVAGFVMYAYDFVPVKMGEIRAGFEWTSFMLQGMFLAAITGFVYDKFMEKTPK